MFRVTAGPTKHIQKCVEHVDKSLFIFVISSIPSNSFYGAETVHIGFKLLFHSTVVLLF